jgi:hypothetical protein
MMPESRFGRNDEFDALLGPTVERAADGTELPQPRRDS